MAARLGAGVTFIGCVGDDPMGQATIDNFGRHGVETSGTVVVPGASTGVAPIWVDDAGTNRILIAPGANDSLDGDLVLAALERLPTRPAIVLAQLETPQPASTVAFEWAARSGACAVLNPAPAARIDSSLASWTDWLIPNESEFLTLFGTAPEAPAIAEAAERSRHGMVVTLGSRGAIVDDRNSTSHVGPPTVDVALHATSAASGIGGKSGITLPGRSRGGAWPVRRQVAGHPSWRFSPSSPRTCRRTRCPCCPPGRRSR